MTTISPTVTRTIRSRQIPSVRENVQPVAQPVSDEMLDLARKFFVENKESNAHSRLAASARTALHKKMVSANIKSFTTTVEYEGSLLSVEARISAPEQDMISVDKLRSLVDDETFMKIVSATKTAVTQYAGTNVCMASTVTGNAKEDLRIKEVER